MKYIFDKFRNFLKTILKYLKAIIVAFFGFFFDLFNNKSISKNIIKKENNIKSQKKSDNKIIESSGHMEEPTTRTKNDNLNFNISNEELEFLVLTRFCKELELKEIDLTNTQKEYIKSLNEKIIPVIQHDITKQYISNSNNLNEEIKKLVIYELEYQFKLEQNNELPTSKIIITPLLSKNNNKEINLNTKETFLASKRNDVKSETQNTEFIISNNKDLYKSSDINNYMINQSFNNSNDTITNVLKIDQIDVLFLEDYKSDVPNYNKINESSIDIKMSDIKSESNVYTPPSNNVDISLNFYEASYNKPTDAIQNPEMVLIETDVNKKLEEEYEKSEEQPNELIEVISENKADIEQYDYYKIDLLISNTIDLYNEEVKKQEFEDKNYDLIQKQLDYLLNEINKLKIKNLNQSQKEKLAIQENKILTLRNNLLIQKQKDISLEQNLLDASILIDDLNSLEEHLQKLHIEDKLDLQEYMLKSLEDLDNLTIDKARKIEKELLKIKLKKALHSLVIHSLLSLPFIHNKYFMFFTGGLLVNRHLKFFDAILKRKSVDFEPEDISQIKSGSVALESSLFMFQQNIHYLNYLESEAFKKYPELKYDVDYLINLNNLKSKLLRQQERLLKKEKMIKKHNLKLKKKIRIFNFLIFLRLIFCSNYTFSWHSLFAALIIHLLILYL